MRANVIPAATLVSVAVFANEEIIADVPPAPIVHVQVLVRSNDRGARLLVPTVLTYTAMMDHHVRRRCDRQNLKIQALPGLPFASADDRRTLGCIDEIRAVNGNGEHRVFEYQDAQRE